MVDGQRAVRAADLRQDAGRGRALGAPAGRVDRRAHDSGEWRGVDDELLSIVWPGENARLR